jgi:UDP-glucose 4-epimerase
MRIAVTGGSGDLARVLIPMLQEAGHSVLSIDRTMPTNTTGNPIGVQAQVVDVSDFGSVVGALTGCDAVIHLAAHRSPMNAPDHVVYRDNTLGSYNILLAAEIHKMTHVCMASSINAIGAVFSKEPQYDYFPLDEKHPCYAQDAYSQSKWVLEQQGDAFARRRSDVAISSLRFHGIIDRDRAIQFWDGKDGARKHVWGYVHPRAAARACIAALNVTWRGHEVFYVVAPDAASVTASDVNARTYYPNVPIRGSLTGNTGFFDCSKAGKLLGWTHSEE